MKKLSREEFIEKANKIHEGKYDYSKVEYSDSQTKVCIICPTHGEFFQKPNDHLQGKGCKKCSKNDKLTTEVFVEKARLIHGDKYDYSKVEYKAANEKVIIECPIHGVFEQTPYNHTNRGQGCPYCAGKGGIQTHILKAIKVHGGKYDYSEANGTDKDGKIKIICPTHGPFYQKMTSHLSGCGCPSCNPNKKKTEDEFKSAATVKYGDTYGLDKVCYVNSKTKVTITCKKHGDFKITPNSFLNGRGCPLCGRERTTKASTYSFDTFTEKANSIHDGKYIYNKGSFDNRQSERDIMITCPIHGEFRQSYVKHLQGHGCPRCNDSHLERKVKTLLERKGAQFSQQQTFEWLVNKANLYLDFYLPKHNIAIECQGVQHFEPIKSFGGEESLTLIKERDEAKRRLCEAHGIKLIYFANKAYEEGIITDEQKLIEAIDTFEK